MFCKVPRGDLHMPTRHVHSWHMTASDPLRDGLRDRLERLGWSQRELAHRSGMDISVVNNYFTGRTKLPDPRTVRKITDTIRDGETAHGVNVNQTDDSPNVTSGLRSLVLQLPAGSLADLTDDQMVELVNVGSACILQRARQMKSGLG